MMHLGLEDLSVPHKIPHVFKFFTPVKMKIMHTQNCIVFMWFLLNNTPFNNRAKSCLLFLRSGHPSLSPITSAAHTSFGASRDLV